MNALRTATTVALAHFSLALSPVAQTTHDVSLFNVSYSPKNLAINVGDTVRWTWFSGTHDVIAGLGGMANGIFVSQLSNQSGFTFEVTFDQAFLDANPVPANKYNYYCSVHFTFGMTGTVQVEIPPTFHTYGCGTNPAGSLTQLGGSSQLGGSLQIGVDNPIATQPIGSLALLAIATAPDPGFPCGTALPGLGMPGPYGLGELLISIAAPNPVLVLPPQVWTGTPSAFNVGIPPSPAFLGLHLYLQGAIAEVSGQFALTDAADVGIGQ